MLVTLRAFATAGPGPRRSVPESPLSARPINRVGAA